MPDSGVQQSASKINPNSALYWYPCIDSIAHNLPVSVPETEFVEYEFTDSFAFLDGEVPDNLPWDEFIEAAREVGWPAFVRTDQKSVKHAGPGAYRAEEPDDLPTILAVLTDHHVKAQRHPAALMVREFVDIHARFRAFDGLPIGREMRVFATPTDVVCDHFYWPEKAIAEGRGTPTSMDGEIELVSDEWRLELDRLSNIPEADRAELHAAAEDTVSYLNLDEELPDETAWSIDFAQDTSGDWWLIDAALAEERWHPDDCPHADELEDENS